MEPIEHNLSPRHAGTLETRRSRRLAWSSWAAGLALVTVIAAAVWRERRGPTGDPPTLSLGASEVTPAVPPAPVTPPAPRIVAPEPGLQAPAQRPRARRTRARTTIANVPAPISVDPTDEPTPTPPSPMDPDAPLPH